MRFNSIFVKKIITLLAVSIFGVSCYAENSQTVLNTKGYPACPSETFGLGLTYCKNMILDVNDLNRSDCKDLRNDSYNCGDCGSVCPDIPGFSNKADCISGKCELDCKIVLNSPFAKRCTSGEPVLFPTLFVCTDISHDNYNCGECGNICHDSKKCVEGKCR